MDSAVLLAEALNSGYDPLPVAFNYGQRHARELESARNLADYYGRPFHVVHIPRLSSPALTGGDNVPHGHYAADTMVDTIVQGRNLIFAAHLVGLANPGDHVWLGVHSGDHAIYPDCRPEFVSSLADAAQRAYQVTVTAPFVDRDKAWIAARGDTLGVPFRLTWSCYEGGSRHCGRCGTCVERAEAFHLAGVHDPTWYVDAAFWRTQVGI